MLSRTWGIILAIIACLFELVDGLYFFFVFFCSFFPGTAGSPASLDTLHVHTLVCRQRPGEELYNYIEPFYAEHIREFCNESTALEAAPPTFWDDSTALEAAQPTSRDDSTALEATQPIL